MNYFKCNIISMALAGAMAMMLLTACDKGFREKNINPNAYTEPAIGPLFTTSLIRTVGTVLQTETERI